MSPMWYPPHETEDTVIIFNEVSNSKAWLFTSKHEQAQTLLNCDCFGSIYRLQYWRLAVGYGEIREINLSLNKTLLSQVDWPKGMNTAIWLELPTWQQIFKGQMRKISMKLVAEIPKYPCSYSEWLQLAFFLNGGCGEKKRGERKGEKERTLVNTLETQLTMPAMRGGG